MQVLLLVALCSVLFLGKSLLPGYTVMPFAPEVLEPLRTEALAEGRVAPADLKVGNPVFGDKIVQSLAFDRIIGDRLRDGEIPQWTRDISGGAGLVPTTGQPYIPWAWMMAWIPTPQAYGVWLLLHQVLFAFFAYRFLRRIGVGHLAGLLGALCVGVGLWSQARVHHHMLLSAALPLFAMLSCAHQLAVRGGGAGWIGALALGSGISWLGGMPQTSLLVHATVGGYGAVLCLAHRNVRGFVALAFGLGLGLLLGMAQVGGSLAALQVSSRVAGDAAVLQQRALEWEHVLGAIWPDLLHWPAEFWHPGDDPEATRPSWFALWVLEPERILGGAINYAETAFAIGLPALLLAFAGVLHRGRVTAVFFTVVCILGFALAVGAGPLPSIVATLPAFNSGDLKRFLFPCAMGLAVLAALGLDDLLKGRGARWLPVLGAALLGVCSVALWVQHAGSAQDVQDLFAERVTAEMDGVGPENFAALVNAGEADANRDRLVASFARSAVVSVLVLLALLLRRRGVGWLLIVLTAVDLLLAGRGTIVPVETERVTTPPRILAPALAATREAEAARPRFQRLLAGPGSHVLVPLLRPNLGAFYGLEDLSAYVPLPSKRMEELFLAIEPDEPGKTSIVVTGTAVDGFRRPESLSHPLLDLLGVRFVLADVEIELPGLVDRTPADYPYRFRLYERTTCLPRATFLSRARVIEDVSERLATLAARRRDVASEVILEAADAPLPDGVRAEHEVVIRSHADQRVVVSVRNSAAGYLRLADPWDPGWTANVDGQPARLFIADHHFRAVWLEPGSHEVVFAYDGAVATWPRRVSAAALFGVLVLLAAARFRRRRDPVASAG